MFFPTLFYTSTHEIPTLLNTSSLKKIPFSGGTSLIGHYTMKITKLWNGPKFSHRYQSILSSMNSNRRFSLLAVDSIITNESLLNLSTKVGRVVIRKFRPIPQFGGFRNREYTPRQLPATNDAPKTWFTITIAYLHMVSFLQTYCPCRPTHSKISEPFCPTPRTA